MRVRHLAQAQQAEAVLLRLVDAVEGEHQDVGTHALEVGDGELRVGRHLHAGFVEVLVTI